ncbi:hypothetical protein LTR10_021887 [Elasticomyces elasticus]|uniref:F-box domain-containing protein n=1 Tax=Exophiala sideris TaxID=1016849 RepID=A0ABR0JQD9_9EURO|nr:hypothetical protein LTR10_021887 [Elasticomyces elasticus]KAK5039802.1 hypothetical protein LTS07_000297 [Exophiala sideris]KAK5041354.1 hypothetical protein LTR13_002829 [Exophiala sideris]KAK5068181.1 hypothetical protein LTR69_000299 [Exophiala sideris]KAK5187482.1 hypothetical protein LTR44_000298 [Eurotiomycetes sp. CCFEE 6388]
MQPSSTSARISELPPELLHQILTYLPISNLLTFARTSKQHYSASTLALQDLQLAVLPKRVHGILAFLNASNFDDLDHNYTFWGHDSLSRNQIIVPSTLPVPSHRLKRSRSKKPPDASRQLLTPVQYREELFQLQNALSCSILSTPSLVNLQSLTLHIYNIISPSLSETIATRFPKLRHLHLNFNHPYLHDTCLPAQYWTSPLFLKGSPLWNSLAGLGRENEAKLRLTRLESLTVERAGITSVQLQRWIGRNLALKELTLRNVMGVDAEFVEWLGQYYGRQPIGSSRPAPARLRHLALESCANLSLQSVEDFRWLDNLTFTESTPYLDEGLPDLDGCPDTALQALSLHGSPVSTTSLLKYLDETRPPLRQITLPSGRVLVARTTEPRVPETSMSAQNEHDLVQFPALESRIGAVRTGSTHSLNDVGAVAGGDDSSVPSYFRSVVVRSLREYDAKSGCMGVIEPDTR